jgi:hypothetical protein
MSSHSSERSRERAPRAGAQGRGASSGAKAGVSELTAWLHERVGRLAGEWSEEVRTRGREHSPFVDDVVARFLLQLTSFLPLLLGPRREDLQPLWSRACELFGTLAAKRGLAAGEVIEEFQVLRELLIRDLYESPLASGAPTLRETLRLNRALDRGVTHASVGHTDAMFFQLLEASGAGAVTTPDEAAREAHAQLEVIREELADILGRRLPGVAELPAHAP